MKNFYFFLSIILLVFLITKTPKTVQSQIICDEETVVFNNYEVYAALSNVFTPNNDGINDLLVVYNSFAQQRLIQINDTTANNKLLFSSMATDQTAFWDGLDENAQEAPEAAYNLRVDYLFGNGVVELTCRTIYLVRENCIDLSDVELNFPTDFDDLNLTFTDTETVLPDCIVGINESSIEADIQPTLVQNKVMVSTTKPVNQFSVYDLTGKIMLSKELINRSNFELKLDELPTGIYYLLLDHNGEYTTHQFYKK